MKKFLQTWIEERGHELGTFAGKLGVPYQTLYGYARADRRIPLDLLRRAAKELGISAEDILQKGEALQEDATPYRVPTGLDLLTDAELQELICNRTMELKKGDPEERHRAVRTIAGAASVLEQRWRKAEDSDMKGH
jgi:hypothetical protein